MGQINLEGLGAVQETLIIPLAMRALDLKSKRPILGDERAARLYEEITYSDKKFSPKKSPSYYGCLKRAGYMDGELIRYARELHAQGKPFVTVNAGCGLDTRGERIAGATYGAAHYDVDFPNVIELRQRLLGESATALGSDLLEGDWLSRIASEITPETQVLITIEGVFAYFTLEQIQLLLEHLHRYFAGRCVLVFDALSSFWAGRSKMHDTLKHMEATFVGGIDSEADILRLLPQAQFERKKAVVDLMAEVWWVAHLMQLTKKMRESTQIFTFRL